MQYDDLSCLLFQVERKKIDQMKLAESFLCTMPKSDASTMIVEAKLINEKQEIILEMGELNVGLLTVSYLY